MCSEGAGLSHRSLTYMLQSRAQPAQKVYQCPHAQLSESAQLPACILVPAFSSVAQLYVTAHALRLPIIAPKQFSGRFVGETYTDRHAATCCATYALWLSCFA